MHYRQTSHHLTAGLAKLGASAKLMLGKYDNKDILLLVGPMVCFKKKKIKNSWKLIQSNIECQLSLKKSKKKKKYSVLHCIIHIY